MNHSPASGIGYVAPPHSRQSGECPVSEEFDDEWFRAHKSIKKLRFHVGVF
jgi:hypothetical protein